MPFILFPPSKLKAIFCQVYMTLNSNVLKVLLKIEFLIQADLN